MSTTQSKKKCAMTIHAVHEHDTITNEIQSDETQTGMSIKKI